MCCVAWGRTIATTVEHVPTSSTSDWEKQFIPIAGEPTNHEPSGVSPSDAARKLALAWPDSTSLSLRGVQARIPKSVHDNGGGPAARELIEYSNSYRQIFGPSGPADPLISDVPMILTGIGNVDTSKRNIAGVGPDLLRYPPGGAGAGVNVLESAVGNIGGVWIAENVFPPRPSRRVAQVRSRLAHGPVHTYDFRVARRPT